MWTHLNPHLLSSWISSPQFRNISYKTQMSGTQRLSSFFRDCRSICRSKNPHSSLTGTEQSCIQGSELGLLPLQLAPEFFRRVRAHIFDYARSRFPCMFLQSVLCCPFCHCVTKHQNCKIKSSSLQSLFRLLSISLSSKDLQQCFDFRDRP